MQFHLGFQPAVSQHKITHQDGVLFLGSCFSEHIANRLLDLKFTVNTNPFGIVFNPKSIISSLHRIIHKKHFKEIGINLFMLKSVAIYKLSNND